MRVPTFWGLCLPGQDKHLQFLSVLCFSGYVAPKNFFFLSSYASHIMG